MFLIPRVPKMHQYHHNPEHGLLSIRHFDDFVGAESATALVTINRFIRKRKACSQI